jgi:amidohydrolase
LEDWPVLGIFNFTLYKSSMSLTDSILSIPDIDQIVSLRQYLHQHPELSGQEHDTSHTLRQFIKRYHPDAILANLADTGFAVIFESKETTGPTVLFRAELDALPIVETNAIPYASGKDGVSHKCGHDGHMAILVGLASLLHSYPLSTGRVVLLFQPAEETGAGAWSVLQAPRFQELQPDFVFALHNMPGYPLQQVILRDQTFAAASVGMKVNLYGKESHAAEPENGLNPGIAMSELMQALHKLVDDQTAYTGLTLLTIIHARLGEIAFGTNPGFATVMATLRAFEQQDLNLLKTVASEAVEQIALKHQLRYSIEFVEEFPATVNAPEAARIVEKAAMELGLNVENAVQPVRWSEDFGHFTHAYPGALFGLGAGPSQPQLHHADYDFPDELIPVGSALFYRVAKHILSQ